jgi:ketosteroid isomerase-like protein
MSDQQAENQNNDQVSHADIVQRGWEAVGRGDWDTLISDYTEDMIFIMPSQNVVLEGTVAFRSVLDNLGAALPPGFEITSIRQIGEDEVVSIVEWKCEKIPGGSQLSVLFKFEGGKISEERWFIDTEQWKAAF